IMDNGKILVEGAPADLVKEHAGSEIVEVEGSDDVVTCLRELDVPFEKTGDMVQVTATTETAREVARTVLERCRPARMITRPATLEDVFLKLTGRNLRE
ncbi:MAG TPA: ABC transporter ATP-binding protein, partial [Methanoregula sp.]|nr:ABC transporter ATP-binding protein [Methanoregula sp.]